MQAFHRQRRLSSEVVEGAALLWGVLELAVDAGVADLESLLALPDEDDANDC